MTPRVVWYTAMSMDGRLADGQDSLDWLVSHDAALVEQVGPTDASFTRVEGELGPMFEAIAASGHRRVWLCGGGDVAGQTLALDRIDEVIVTMAPVALGAGPSLFEGTALPSRGFSLVECRNLGGGAARIVWRREREQAAT